MISEEWVLREYYRVILYNYIQLSFPSKMHRPTIINSNGEQHSWCTRVRRNSW